MGFSLEVDSTEITPLSNQTGPSISPSTQVISNEYIHAATSDNTRKAYRSDIRHFEQWGGRLPALPETIISYLKNFAPQLNPRTLSRRLTAIKQWHVYQGFPDPTANPSVSKTLSGIIRVHGRPKEKAHPLSPEDLRTLINHLKDSTGLAAVRDNALLQVGYFGAFRRSELVHIQYEHIRWLPEGIEILLPHSKTDQEHAGQYCALPYGREHLCPIKSLKDWLEHSGITAGPLFRRIYLNGKIACEALTPLSVNQILKKRATECGLSYQGQLSSHSLRRGLATSASRLGAGIPAIMRQGRWKQVNTVMEYIEAAERFTENAAASILQKGTEKLD